MAGITAEDGMTEHKSADPKLTQDELWRRTVEYVRKSTPAGLPESTFYEVCVKVFDKMRWVLRC